jgi:hypothetical protein
VQSKDDRSATIWVSKHTIMAPSPRRTLTANSGTGSHEGRPNMAPILSHISFIRTGFGAVPFITPATTKTYEP